MSPHLQTVATFATPKLSAYLRIAACVLLVGGAGSLMKVDAQLAYDSACHQLPITSQLGPNKPRMLVIGDSIAWGEGLETSHKFWCKAAQWLKQQTGEDLTVEVYAHAGAVINPETADRWERTFLEKQNLLGLDKKEVNVSFPTVRAQIDIAAKRLDPTHVAYILMDGCINDVNKSNIVSTTLGTERLKTLVDKSCGEDLEKALLQVGESFPRAKVVVTGYYPLVFAGIPPGAKGKNLKEKGTANDLVTKLLVASVSGQIAPECKQDVRVCLAPMSSAWADESDRDIENAVRVSNEKFGGRFAFARLHFSPEFGFSTPHSMLWTLNFHDTHVAGLRKVVDLGMNLLNLGETNDEMLPCRKKQCNQAEHDLVLAGLPDNGSFSTFNCNRGSLAHPNRFGAALYAQSVIDKLEELIDLNQIESKP